jgi:hypothetical protein
MAWSGSEVFMAFIEDSVEDTADLDMNTDSFKAALFDNDITPSQTVTSANTAYAAGQWVSAGNEVYDGAEWTVTGTVLGSVTSTFSSTTYTFDSADVVSAGSSATLANVYGCLLYDDSETVVADQGVSYHYFGGANSVTDGTFTIVVNASGWFTITG